MRTQGNQLILLFCFWSLASALTNSVLDLAEDCGKSLVEEDICISPSDPLITKTRQARSDIECVLGCKELNSCASVFRDSEGDASLSGTCYELSASDVEHVARDIGIPTGSQIKLIQTGDAEHCGSKQYNCSLKEVCFQGCGGVELSDSVCVADARKNCQLAQEYSNARYYWSPIIADGRDSGTVMMVTYPKHRASSGLRVIIHMNVRGHYYAAGYCNHWYLTFDDSRCTNPENIEQLDYSARTGDYHRAMDIDGTCYGLDEGNRNVKLVIGTCDGYSSTDGYAGWNSPRSMILMEVIPQGNAVSAMTSPARSCPHSAVFNYQYYSWNEAIDTTFDTRTASELVKAVPYTKLSNDTSLRIKYNALLGVKVTNNGYRYCGRWYLAINGTECTPKADVIISHDDSNAYSYWSHHVRVYTVEGICDNELEAGSYSIEIYMGKCYWNKTEPTNFIVNSHNSPSRLHIEEVRKEKKVTGVYSQQHTVFRSLTGYLARHHYYNFDDDTNEGTLLTVTYPKQFTDTDLRLTATGTHSSDANGGYSQCARWYFMIDNSACTNPGAIEAVSYWSETSRSYQPMQISGVCSGISSGTRTITYAVGRCSGYNPSDAKTGSGASFHIFVEELRTDLVKTCDSNPVQCYGP